MLLKTGKLTAINMPFGICFFLDLPHTRTQCSVVPLMLIKWRRSHACRRRLHSLQWPWKALGILYEV